MHRLVWQLLADFCLLRGEENDPLADNRDRQKSTVHSLSGAGQVPDPEDCGG